MKEGILDLGVLQDRIYIIGEHRLLGKMVAAIKLAKYIWILIHSPYPFSMRFLKLSYPG